MGLLDTLAEFVSPEAGQRRRAALDRVDQRINDALGYYLGPQLAPRVQQAANLGGLLSPGQDVVDAYQASGEMMAPERGLIDRAASGAALAGAVGAMVMPGGVSSIRQGVDDLAEAGVRATRSPTLGSNAGNLAADAATETPAQQIARLLRDGRGAEVTDELYAQADPQELSRLYDAGATGMDMPMGPAALERARAGGFDVDTPLYHGSRKDFSAFRNDIEKKTDHGWYGEGAYFGDPETASIYAMNDPNVARPQGGNVIEAFARGNVYEWPEGRPAALDAQGAKEISQSLAAEGYAGANIYAPNDPDLWGEQAGSWRERVVFDPANIRSRFARFDPRLSHLRNLSAGLAGAGALGLGLLSMPPSQAEAEQYLAERGLLQ